MQQKVVKKVTPFVTLALLLGVFSFIATNNASALPANLVATATTLSPNSDSSTIITATTDPIETATTVSETLTSEWDANSLQLTGAPTIPDSWTATYYDSTGTVLGANPTWSQVKKIVTNGQINSGGVQGGKQIATKTAQGFAPVPNSSFNTSGSGDGWAVFFDPGYTRVFNLPHHDSPSPVVVDCHWLYTTTGANAHVGAARCPGYPYRYGTAIGRTLHNSSRAIGQVDSKNRLWIPTTDSTGKRGFACLNVKGDSPALCSTPYYELESAAYSGYDNVADIAYVGGKLFTHSSSGAILCLDISIADPAPCLNQPYAGFNATASTMGDIAAASGKLYVLNAGATGELKCLDPSRIATSDTTSASVSCLGFTTGNIGLGPILVVTNSNGNGLPVALCGKVTCLGLDGGTSPAGLPSGFSTYYSSHSLGALSYGRQYSNSSWGGTKTFWASGGYMNCYDSKTNAACWTAVAVGSIYSTVVDPSNSDCVWADSDSGNIGIYSAKDGTSGCSTPPPTVKFPTSVSIPRMACTNDGTVVEFKTYTLNVTDPQLAGKFTNATLDVVTPDGTSLMSVVIDSTTGIVDIHTIPISGSDSSGPWNAGDLSFNVSFSNPTYTAIPVASITIVADAPQMCVPLKVILVCPAGGGYTSGNIPLWNGNWAILFQGGVSTAADGYQAFNDVTVTLTPGHPTDDQCPAALLGGGSGGGSGPTSPPTPVIPPKAADVKVELRRGEKIKLLPSVTKGTWDLKESVYCLIDPATKACGNSVVIPGEGKYSAGSKPGEFEFTPLPNFVGKATGVEYRIADIILEYATGRFDADVKDIEAKPTPSPSPSPTAPAVVPSPSPTPSPSASASAKPTPTISPIADSSGIIIKGNKLIIPFKYAKFDIKALQSGIIKAMALKPNSKILVDGYAESNVGADDLRISTDRALEVRKWIQKTVPKVKIDWNGRGIRKYPDCAPYLNKCAIVTVVG